jgi:hemerythrin
MSDQIKSEIEENKQLKSALDRFFNQAEKWLEAFKIEDSKQMNRQHNRLSKTIDDLGAFTMSDGDQQFIDRLTKQINSKSDKELPSIQQKKPSSGMKFR